MQKLPIQQNFRMSKELYSQIKRLCRTLNIRRTDFYRDAIEAWAKRQEKRIRREHDKKTK
jgi:predicted DNA-binding protein